MSRAQEKQGPLDLLKHKLQLLGLADTPAAQNMLKDLEPERIPGPLVESVNQLLTFALERQKEQFKRALQELSQNL